MDWSACVICQKNTAEDLRCPLNRVGGSAEKNVEAYKVFLNNVSRLRALNSLPRPILFDEGTTPADFVQNQAKWHKSCHKDFSNFLVERAERKRDSEDAGPSTYVCSKQARRDTKELSKTACIFCTETNGRLHEVTTFSKDAIVHQMATDLQDTKILARLGPTDLMASEAKYHQSCMNDFRNRHRSHIRQKRRSDNVHLGEEERAKARAFLELCTYIELSVRDGIFFFKLTELRGLYTDRLKALGVHEVVNPTRFKELILEYFPGLQVQHQKNYIVIAFKEGMQDILKQAMDENIEEGVATLAKAATIVREDIFGAEEFVFDGSFPRDCQQKYVPTSLKTLVSMLLYGTNIQDQKAMDTQACLSISQMLFLNCKKNTKSKCVTSRKSRYCLQRETPLAVYTGMRVHTQTRSRALVELLHELRISVSYKRIMQLESHLASAVCRQIQREGVVCPSQLRHGLFTIGAMDNLDHNPSSTSAVGSFHGTGISLMQSPSKTQMGKPRPPLTLTDEDKEGKLSLPDYYTVVPAVALKETSVQVPKLPGTDRVDRKMEEAEKQERKWLKTAMEHLPKERLEAQDTVGWAAFHAPSDADDQAQREAAITQLLPLFTEKAATFAMVKHSMDVIRQSTTFLNPAQIPVMAVDAPLFRLAKFIQWKWPDTYGEEAFVIMFGGLHTEMKYWETIGDYLDSSGWTAAIVKAGITTSGTADSFLRCSHLTRTRHMHQVSALAVATIQQEAFQAMSEAHTEEAMEAWRAEMIAKSPTFQFWDTVLSLELLGLTFVRAHRRKDFALYVETLKAITPWFFALDHQNYARWLPIHIRDMEHLPGTVLKEFNENGQWAVTKSSRRFSALPIDQVHEQNNALVKSEGGAVGLTENPHGFQKWMLAGPEQARLLKEFEAGIVEESEDDLHHEEGLTFQENFKKQTAAMTSTIKNMGNPFLEAGSQLLNIHSRDVLPEDVVQTVRTIESIGKQQYDSYRQSVLEEGGKTSIHDPIRRNSLRLFKCPTTKARQSSKTKDLKDDVSLFSKLYIAAQDRESDLGNFFQHENHPYPPSLSDRGTLRAGTKSDLLSCLIKSCPRPVPVVPHAASTSHNPGAVGISDSPGVDNDTLDPYDFDDLDIDLNDRIDVYEVPSDILESQSDTPTTIVDPATDAEPPSSFDVIVLDGMAVLHFLDPRGSSTFEEFAHNVFLPYISQQLWNTKRLDLVWDCYTEDSLKECTRERRGKGVRRKVEKNARIPTKWQEFLQDPENKTELTKFLSDTIANAQIPPGKVVVVTAGVKTITRGMAESIPDCQQEEADTRMVFHLLDALKTGSAKCLVRTVDTDVICILIGKFHSLQEHCPQLSIWVAFGTGKKFMHLSINDIIHGLGKDKAEALPAFHAFTGCDCVSSFFGRGKRTAWEAWRCFPEVTRAFQQIMNKPFSQITEDSEQFKLLEHFTVLMYDKASNLDLVNECRRVLFCQKGKSMENIPPSQAALLEHSRRAIYQAGIWATADQTQEDLPSPETWGWSKYSGTWKPYWTSLQHASKACRELIQCGCNTKAGCIAVAAKCSCLKNGPGWTCTELCSCYCKK